MRKLPALFLGRFERINTNENNIEWDLSMLNKVQASCVIWMKTPEVINFILVSLLLILYRFHTLFTHLLWTSKYRLGSYLYNYKCIWQVPLTSLTMHEHVFIKLKCTFNRSSHSEVLCKKVFLKMSQNSQKHICARVSFLIKLQTSCLQLYWKKRLWHRCFPVNFANFLEHSFLIKHIRWLLLFQSWPTWRIVFQVLIFLKIQEESL